MALKDVENENTIPTLAGKFFVLLSRWATYLELSLPGWVNRVLTVIAP